MRHVDLISYYPLSSASRLISALVNDTPNLKSLKMFSPYPFAFMELLALRPPATPLNLTDLDLGMCPTATIEDAALPHLRSLTRLTLDPSGGVSRHSTFVARILDLILEGESPISDLRISLSYINEHVIDQLGSISGLKTLSFTPWFAILPNEGMKRAEDAFYSTVLKRLAPSLESLSIMTRQEATWCLNHRSFAAFTICRNLLSFDVVVCHKDLFDEDKVVSRFSVYTYTDSNKLRSQRLAHGSFEY